MFNDETFGLYGGATSVETEEENESQLNQSTSLGQTGYEQSSYDDVTYDDYSVTPNYSEEQSYNSTSPVAAEQVEEVSAVRGIYMPTIQREQEEEQETVSLIKTRQKITLAPRMKIIISAFSVVMFALLFLIIFNYASLGGINATIADRQITASQLQSDIRALREEYNLVDNDESIKVRAEEAGYVEIGDDNAVYINLGEYYTQETVQDLPSNWFNDLCDFFSKLFA